MKDLLDKIIKPKKTRDIATEAMVKSVKIETPAVKVKIPNPWPRPLHHPSCVCFKCERWREGEKNA